MPESMTPLVAVGVIGALFILLLSLLTNNYSLNNIKSKTVGDGQYGTARWARIRRSEKPTSRFPLTLQHGAPERSARPCRDWFSAVCSAASDWKRWWTATMCIAS